MTLTKPRVLAHYPSAVSARYRITLVELPGGAFATMFAAPTAKPTSGRLMRCSEYTARGHYREAERRGTVLHAFPAVFARVAS